jgi:transcriptional regulator with XRE-family HTH domain
MTKLEHARRARGLSQTDLAAAAGKLSTADISRFERGYGRPYPAQAKRLAGVLGLREAELVDQHAGDPTHAE